MLTGVDTGFFFALESQHHLALKIWEEREIVTSAIVLYELQRKLLHGHFEEWPTLITDIQKSIEVVPITPEVALKAGHIAHGTGMPGLDALILSSLLEAGCEEIYTTDSHLELYRKAAVKIINLKRST